MTVLGSNKPSQPPTQNWTRHIPTASFIVILALVIAGLGFRLESTREDVGAQQARIKVVERVEDPCSREGLTSNICQDRTCIRATSIGLPVTPECKRRLSRVDFPTDSGNSEGNGQGDPKEGDAPDSGGTLREPTTPKTGGGGGKVTPPPTATTPEQSEEQPTLGVEVNLPKLGG